MRKIAMISAAAAAALTLAACSEGTQDAAEATADGAMADTEANMEATGDAMADGAAEVEAGADAMVDGAEAAAVDAEAEMEGETEAEAATD